MRNPRLQTTPPAVYKERLTNGPSCQQNTHTTKQPDDTMRTLVLLWSVIALATAFNCYSMSTTGGDAPGSETKTAACSSHCYK